MLKPTLRRNDRKMVTVQAPHHLGGVELGKLLCQHASDHVPKWYERPPTPGRDMTRAEVEKVLRYAVWAYGEDAYNDEGFGEDDREDENNKVVQWAANQIRRLFPELVDAKLEEWSDTFAQNAEKYTNRVGGWFNDE